MTVRKTILIVSFTFFLYPISVDGLSVNYSFLMFPIGYLLIDSKVRRPQELIYLLMGLFTLIFIIASIYQYEFLDEGLSRIISFIIFMSMFSYIFIKIDAEMIESFKVSIIVIGLYFSLHSLHSFFMLGGSDLGFTAKDLVGGQRFGFIYLLGIWLTYLYQRRGKLYVVIKYSVLLILLCGLFLTFSRSSIVGLLGSFGIFAIANCLRWIKKPNPNILMKGLFSIVAMVFLFVLLFQVIPTTFTFFQERLVEYLMDSSTVTADLTNPESSGGTRLYIAGKVFDFVILNPLTGSGFLGVWILRDPIFGSGHIQYLDVLFRTGFLGFFAYIYLLFLLIRYLCANDRGLFWGLIGILFYGMLHETFKESQGGFVLAFLLGMMSQSLRRTDVDGFPEDITETGRKRRLNTNAIPTKYHSI